MYKCSSSGIKECYSGKTLRLSVRTDNAFPSLVTLYSNIFSAINKLTKEHIVVNVLKNMMQTLLKYLLHFQNSADPRSDLLVRRPGVQLLQVTYCPNLLKSIHLGILYNVSLYPPLQQSILSERCSLSYTRYLFSLK